MTDLYSQKWLKKAKADLKSAELLLQEETADNEIICFHCQQAVEKYLKAYLVYSNIIFPKTHDLDLLLKLCIEKDADFENFDRLKLSMLTDCAVDFRYPGDEENNLDRSEVEDFYRLLLSIRDFVIAKMNILS